MIIARTSTCGDPYTCSLMDIQDKGCEYDRLCKGHVCVHPTDILRATKHLVPRHLAQKVRLITNNKNMTTKQCK